MGVYDAGAQRLKVFSPSGEFLEEVESPAPGGFVLNDFRQTNHGEPLRVHRFGEGWAFETYTGEVSHSGGLWRGRILFLKETGSVPDTLLRYETLGETPDPDGTQLFAAAPLWTVCGGEQIAVLNPLDSIVTGLDQHGKSTQTKVSLELPAITDQALESWVERRLDLALQTENISIDSADLAAMQTQALAESQEIVSPVAPPTKLLCDGAGSLWVQGFSVENTLQGYGPSWTVFAGGSRIASVRFPPGIYPLFLEGDRVVAIWRDELDIERLVAMQNPLTSL